MPTPARRIFDPRILPIGAALLLAACDGHAGSPAPTAAARPVRVETVRLAPVEGAVRHAAVLRPRVEADIGFRVGGKLVRRLVEVGERVELGTQLALLDPADLELQARAIESQLAAAQADAANTSADFQRYAALRRGEWTTQQEHDRRKAAMETGRARVRELEAQLKVARNNTQYAVLRADAPGVVTAVLAEPGQVVGQGQAVFRIARLGEIEAVANIPEQLVAVLPGAALAVELWALPGTTIAGRLRELAPMADAATRTYQARITLTDPPPAAQLGMTATLIVSRGNGALVASLPATALAKQGDQPAMWVLNGDGDGVALKPVQVAAYAGDRVIVASGLADGERVVTAGVHKLDAAQKVRVWTEPER